MALIKIYAPGEHGAGFCGAAIRTKILGEPIQEYFSFKQYGKKKAMRLAKERLAEINELQLIREAQSKLEGKRNSHYRGVKHILCVNHFTMRLDKARSPTMFYSVQYDRKTLIKFQRTFKNRNDFEMAYRLCCIKKIQFEKLEYSQDWLDYYEALRPSFKKVKKYFYANYGYSDWNEPK